MNKIERNLLKFNEIEDCIRWYPCRLEDISEKEIFRKRDIILYVHIPFCKGGCLFCPFNKFIYKEKEVEKYLKSLEKEIKLLSQKIMFGQLNIVSIWIGGGTPSDLSPKQIDFLFKILEQNFKYDHPEITFEGIASFSSFNEEKVRILKKHKVTNISLGVQSLDDKFLRSVIYRRYYAKDAIQTVSFLKNKGFKINIDCMYRLPGQTINEFKSDLNRFISTEVDNITLFPFMKVRGTEIVKFINEKRLPDRPDKQKYFQMYKILLKEMKKKRYVQYTPYHFGKNGFKINYHLSRWGFLQKETLGIGAGAFSYFNNVQYTNIHIVKDYIKAVNNSKIPILKGKVSNDSEILSRYLVLGTKLLCVDRKEFFRKTGYDFLDIYRKEISLLKKQGLLKVTKTKMILTDLGKAFSNEISMNFYTLDNKGILQPLGIDFNTKKK